MSEQTDKNREQIEYALEAAKGILLDLKRRVPEVLKIADIDAFVLNELNPALVAARESMASELAQPPIDLNSIHGEFEKMEAYRASKERSTQSADRPIEILLWCPRCGKQHVDEPKGDWTNPPHATHTCQHCGLLWRPSNENTTGVAGIKALEEKHVERIMASYPAAASSDLRPIHDQDAPLTRRNTFTVMHEGKKADVVFASVSACLERAKNAPASASGDTFDKKLERAVAAAACSKREERLAQALQIIADMPRSAKSVPQDVVRMQRIAREALNGK